MHWCVNINALQRPFSSDFFLLSWLLPSPEESVSSVKYHFLLFRPEIPGHHCCLVADSNAGRKRGCRKRMNRVWLHISTPPWLPHIYKASYFRYTASCNPVTICIRCAIKPLYVSYLHKTGREKHLLANLTRGPVSSLFPRELTGLGPEGMRGASTRLQVEDGCSVVLQKQLGISSRE